jgi:hypothetical protein
MLSRWADNSDVVGRRLTRAQVGLFVRHVSETYRLKCVDLEGNRIVVQISGALERRRHPGRSFHAFESGRVEVSKNEITANLTE